MIGTLDNARLLATSTRRELTGMDWRVIGSGCDRVAWLAPDGIVYKRIHDTGDCDSNDLEWENFERLSEMDLPENFFLAETFPYYIGGETIIAQEYITGGSILRGFLNDIFDNFSSKFGILDAGYENVIVKGGRYYLIDIVC